MRRRLLAIARILGAPASWALGALCSSCAGKAPEVGDPAPQFVLPASDGRTYDSKDLYGKKVVVVAWFPKAFTGG